MINFKDAAHWYLCPEGVAPEPKHDSDLRKARKELLYPSITTVDKDVFRNPGIERYVLNQLSEAAANHPRQPHESAEDYQNRIYKISCEHRDTAASFGQDVHAAIEDYPQLPMDEKLAPWIQQFGIWYDANVAHPLHKEKILVNHTLGIAGRCDFIAQGKGRFEGKIVMPDYKTQDVKKTKTGKKTPAFYDSWVRQLSFYADGYYRESGCLSESIVPISLVIDSNEPCEPFEKIWTPEETDAALEDVYLGAYQYFKSRDYWPQPNGSHGLKHEITNMLHRFG